MRAYVFAINSVAFFALLSIANSSNAGCTGWPVTCDGAPQGSGAGVPGAAGAAAGILGIGLQMLMEQSTQGAAPQGSQPSSGASPESAAGPEVTPSEKANLLNQLRPLREGTYTASDPGTATTTDTSSAGQLRPIDADDSALQAQKDALLQQMRPLDSPEAASAGASQVFDTAPPGAPARSAADQLCQAAGKGNGCIGTARPGRAPSARGKPGRPATVATAPIDSAAMVRPIDSVCGVPLNLDRPVALGSLAIDPRRGGGYPIASSLDQLRSFDYSDIQANLAAMSPEQLARLKVAAEQEAARLQATLDLARVKLFGIELGASGPAPSYTDAAKDAVYESVKDAAPAWRLMEEIGEGKTGIDRQTTARYIDEIDAAANAHKTFIELRRTLKGLSGKPGLSELTKAEVMAILETTFAVDRASKGDWAGASEHGGKAAQALLPAGEWLVPAAAEKTLVRSQAYLKVALIAIDVGERGYFDVYDRTAQAKQVRSDRASSALELGSRIDALKGKLRDVQKLQDLIAQEPRCR